MDKKAQSNASLDRLGFKRLSDRVYEAIKEKIISLEFQPGAQLVEKQLASELGVSKSPIRDAFQRLEQDGLVYSVPFRGCFVSDLTAEEFKEVFQLREALEIFCLEETLASYTQEEIRELRLANQAAKKELEKGSKARAFKRHLDMHALLVEKLGNHLISNIYSNIINNKLKRYLNMGLSLKHRVRLSNEEHKTLIEALDRRNLGLASRALKDHLSNILEEYLKRFF
jgi:DNA-binding GntR family transcriptional regulator